MTKPIEVKTGVRQGCLLSPLLFLMVLDWVSKNAYEGKRLGLQWTLTQRLEDVDYADDLFLLTHRLVDVKEKGERLQETGGQTGLKINIQKTKKMQIGVSQQESLELHGEAVERVSELTYLGSIISETGGTDEDIIARIRKAQSTFSMLMPVLKKKMYQIANIVQDFQVCPSVWFGNLEIDETTDQEIANLYQLVFKILNIRWPEVISNEELGERTQQIRIDESIMRRTWKWIGHTLFKRKSFRKNEH